MRTRLWLAVVLMIAASVAQAQSCRAATRAADRSGGLDKKIHFAGSFVAGMFAKDLALRHGMEGDWPAFALAMVPGVLKEISDASEECNVFSRRDLVADALGAFVGVKIGGLVVTPRSVSYSMQF